MPRLTSRRWLVLAAGVAALAGVAAPPAWAWHHLRAARAALAAHHPEQARASLAACARVWGGADVHLLASRAARQAGDLEAADAALRDSQRLRGGATEETAFEWALTRAAAGNVREVETYLQQKAEESPAAAALVWEAMTDGYLRVYRTLDAMTCVNHWLKGEPDNPRALDLRGQVFVTGKGVVRGAEDYRRVLELDPTRKQTRRRLAACLIDLGTYEEAAEHLEVFARAAPDDPAVAAQLARCYVMTKRGAEARRLLDGVLAAHPDHGPCLRVRGQVALTAEPPDLAEAEAFLARAAAALPDDYQTNWSYAEALRQRGKTAEARARLARAEELRDRAERIGELRSRKLAEQPLDPALHYEMGVLLLRSGHAEVGVQWLVSALQLDPDHRPSHAALADHYARAGDPARAADHRSKATAPDKK